MKRLVTLARFVWEFVAGDDWLTAVGIAAALGLTALVDDHGAAWVVTPLAVAALLALSVWRVARSAAGPDPRKR
jgi:hypothetical protein